MRRAKQKLDPNWQRKFNMGRDAAYAGLPCQFFNAHYVDGWRIATADRRAAAGEAMLVIGPATRCLSCGDTNYGYRFGCKEADHRVEYGGYVWRGERPDSPFIWFFVSTENLLLAADHITLIDQRNRAIIFQDGP